MNSNDKRNHSSLSFNELSPSVAHVNKKPNFVASSPIDTNMQSLLPQSLQTKIASIMQSSNVASFGQDPGSFPASYSLGANPASVPISLSSNPPLFVHATASSSGGGNQSAVPNGTPTDPVSSTPGISDTDILRIAVTVKSIMAAEIQSIVSNLVGCIDTLAEENKKLKAEVDDLEMYSRRNCVRIFGVDEGKSDTDAVVIDIASKLDVNLERKDLVVSHRVGRSVNGKPRAIIARITNYQARHKLIRESRKLRHVDGMKSVSVNQELTKVRAKLAYQCRELVRKKKAKSTFVWDGKIIVIDNTDNKHVVTHLDHLLKVYKALDYSD
ncbi:hypothetical protein FSP39_007026 [Pinctada imbricata]|uniref:Uncharacterized protein n=1 Tax=Pinctada imbricata TaxID=66713 RepID=A0AA89BUK4_PINIB|nr:hypothetical protein FSP39_007026 [Pinctada imbricata]